jgi:NADP-dependent aldehyde dehydrogenase
MGNSRKHIKLLATGSSCGHAGSAVPALYSVSAQTFQSDAWLHEEVFGRCSLVVWCESMDEMKMLLAGLVTPIPHCPTAEQRQLDLVPFIDSPVSRAFKFFRNLFFQASLRAATL